MTIDDRRHDKSYCSVKAEDIPKKTVQPIVSLVTSDSKDGVDQEKRR